MRRGTDEEMERDRDRDSERERNAVVRLVRASSSTGCTSSLLYLSKNFDRLFAEVTCRLA